MRALRVILRSYTIYRPMRGFMAMAAVLMVAGAAPGARYQHVAATEAPSGHLQWLLPGAVLLFAGFQAFAVSLLASATAWNGKTLEKMPYLLRPRNYETRA